MLNKLQKRRDQTGFTIIEVLIVLAIAGLIMVVVFLAVPNLQRSQRNSGRKTDASHISAAASDFVSNSNGTMPTSAADAVTILNDSGKFAQYSFGTTGATTPTAGSLAIVTGAETTAQTPADNLVYIVTKSQCSTSVSDIQTGKTVGGSTRQMALVYSIETNSGWTLSCLNI